jgi:hypothetical protein
MTMSLYNMLFGRNPKSDLLLAVLGLRSVDIERLRDVHASEDGSTISVYTRTGGGNRDDYPNLTMRKRPEWAGSEDDDFDSTYCTDTFAVPEQWRADVAALSDLLANGMRAEFARHLAATLKREPTDKDKANALYEQERQALARTDHFMANGHTFVPKNDSALKVALDLAETNGGKLRSCWGIAPIVIHVKRDFHPYPKAKDEGSRQDFRRVDVSYDYGWVMDVAYWEHMKERFAESHPLTMAQIAETVEQYIAKQAA